MDGPLHLDQELQHRSAVPVPMMLVVGVGMLMLVPLGQVHRQAEAHQQPGKDQGGRQRLRHKDQRQRRAAGC